MVFVDVKHHAKEKKKKNTTVSELSSCVKVKVVVLGSPSLTVLMVSQCKRN